jgi:ABC-type branched-subunit amino acid transport system substrate-binding protein
MRMRLRTRRWFGVAVVVALSLVAVACGGDSDDTSSGDEPEAADIDYEAIGLWDDGACDDSLPPLVVGTSTVFESPVISLGELALSLEAAADAFNERGGANGPCIEVHTCDDGADADQSLQCARELDAAGIHATINDTTTSGNAEVAAAFSEAGIPRVATNVSPDDWADPNAFPMDASSTGVTILLPSGLLNEDVKEIGILRADLAQTGLLEGILSDMYADDGATFPFDMAVPAGTTDYTQFILSAQEAGVGGVMVALGQQEAVQLMRAGSQLNSDLLVGASLGTFPHAAVEELGDFAEQMVFVSSFAPATVDLPVYEALRDDLANSGEEKLQPGNITTTAMRSWIGLYSLLWMIREADMTEFSRDGLTAMLQEAKDVPMLDMYGGENWTPNKNHEGTFQRAGMNHWGFYRWDPETTAPGGLQGNFVESGETSFDETMCGSPFGAPPPC